MMRERKSWRKGFTLAELLIVVAIIGVLVAISIPIFTAQLNKSKVATDKANLRAYYAEVVADYMSDPDAFVMSTHSRPSMLIGNVSYEGALESGDFCIKYAYDGEVIYIPAN